MHRGDIVICVLNKDYGKPRPAVVLQSDLFNPTHPSIVVCPLTTHLIDAPLFRLTIEPSKQSGITQKSQIMVDKISAINTNRIRDKIGKLAKNEMDLLNHATKIWLHL